MCGRCSICWRCVVPRLGDRWLRPGTCGLQSALSWCRGTVRHDGSRTGLLLVLGPSSAVIDRDTLQGHRRGLSAWTTVLVCYGFVLLMLNSYCLILSMLCYIFAVNYNSYGA